MKQHKFLTAVFDNGVTRFEAGKAYPISDETTRQAAQGHAVEVEVVEGATSSSAEPQRKRGK